MSNNTVPVRVEEFLESVIRFENASSPIAVLDALHRASMRMLRMHVLGAGRMPLTRGDWSVVQQGKNVFVHKSAPEGWIDQYLLIGPKQDDITLLLAELGIAPYTWGEARRFLSPTGIDQWSYELALGYGVRDAFVCPVGARWVVAFWSRKTLAEGFDSRAKALLFLGASLAAIRLEALVSPDQKRVGRRAELTARETAVLRLSSRGKRLKEIAEHLDLGIETVRSHFKKAQEKLGAKSQVHAVAEAIRFHLIV